MLYDSGVYVLCLEGSKYYVGSSENIEKRVKQHQSLNYASAWTTKYAFQSVYCIYPRDINTIKIYEEQIVFDMMEKFGIENVRGGAFAQVDLDEDMKMSLEKMLKHRQNACLNCGDQGHYISQCKKDAKQEKGGFWNFLQKGMTVLADAQKLQQKTEIRIKCFRCGRENHVMPNCYAKTHVNGKILC